MGSGMAIGKQTGLVIRNVISTIGSAVVFVCNLGDVPWFSGTTVCEV